MIHFPFLFRWALQRTLFATLHDVLFNDLSQTDIVWMLWLDVHFMGANNISVT